MSILGNPTQKSPERAFALQKYLLLHSQHDALRRHLDSISQSSDDDASLSASSSPSTSSSGSVTPSTYGSISSHHQGHRRNRRSSSVSFAAPTMSPISELPSPADSLSSTDSAPQRPGLQKRRSSLPETLSTTPSISEVEEEELKLMNVNQQIKQTLTELLNCESVRADRRYRTWVQTRLMDAERELRGERSASRSRRRSVDVGMTHL